jgi:hypothetical protein
VSERAHGFSFSGEMFFDAARDETLVLDFGVSHVTAICRDGDGDGVCDADDDCPAVADPGQEDADGDGIGDACDLCTGVVVDKAKVVVAKLLTPGGDDALAFSGRLGLPAPVVAALDPVAHGLRLVVTDRATTILDATLPGGAFDAGTKTGWKFAKGTFKYANGSGGIQGVRSAKVKPSTTDPGLVIVAVRGKKGSYAVAAGDLPLRATIVLDASACADADFEGLAPDPSCTYDAGKGRVKCK